MTDQPRVAVTAEEIVEASRLLDIQALVLHATRRLDVEPPARSSITPAHGLKVNIRDDHQAFRVIFATELELVIGEVKTEFLAEYELDDRRIESESGAAITSFVNNVALMHILPYVRQGIADLTARVFGTPIVMPIIQRNEITFNIEVSTEEQTAHAD